MIGPVDRYASGGAMGLSTAASHLRGIVGAALSGLLAGLDGEQTAAARLRLAPRDLLIGPPRDDWHFPTHYDGREDVGAARLLEEYDRDLDRTRFAFGGRPTLAAAGDEVRTAGPRVDRALDATRHQLPRPSPPTPSGATESPATTAFR